jgi:hypothetical protein
MKQLETGVLNDDLLTTMDEGWQPATTTAKTAERLESLKLNVGRAVHGRPKDSPCGAAAVQRQQGAGSVTSGLVGRKPAKNNEPAVLAGLPKRGEIWPGKVEEVSLPPEGTRPISLMKLSVSAARYFEDFEKKMLRSRSERVERRQAQQEAGQESYMDPRLREHVLQLGVRMALAGMLKAVKVCRNVVGMFTVVKKAEVKEGRDPAKITIDDVKLSLRLVFDQRSGNQDWIDPPWIGLSGPTAMAALDIGEEIAENPDLRLKFRTGDAPDWFYRLGVPEAMAEWFCLDGLSGTALYHELVRLGHEDAAGHFLGDLNVNEAVGAGVGVLVMGWSWAGFFAQCALCDVVAEPSGGDGTPLLKQELALVEGGPALTMRAESDLVHSEYVDDYAVAALEEESGRMAEQAGAAIKESFQSKGIPVHKEEIGEEVKLLGFQVGGPHQEVRGAPEKLWVAIEALWHLAVVGRGVPAAVEAVVALSTCLMLVKRCLLSVYEKVFEWCQKHREVRECLRIPQTIRRELAAASALLPLAAQSLKAVWYRKILLGDASEEGGAFCSTAATISELRKEAKWAVRGGWSTLVSETMMEERRGLVAPRVPDDRYAVVVEVP